MTSIVTITMKPHEANHMIRPSNQRPTDWFEDLYAAANRDGQGVPWANMAPHPAFIHWLKGHDLQGNDQTALVVGCGMGDDAIELEERGFEVTAFDVSPTAIDYCRQRFPGSKVNFQVADLLAAQPAWQQSFNFVLEIYTVQALPPDYEDQSIQSIAGFTAPGGNLLTIANVQPGPRDINQGPPWLLTPEHIQKFARCGFDVLSSEEIQRSASGAPTAITFFQRKVNGR